MSRAGIGVDAGRQFPSRYRHAAGARVFDHRIVGIVSSGAGAGAILALRGSRDFARVREFASGPFLARLDVRALSR